MVNETFTGFDNNAAMDELVYILSLAFSGADLTRALWLGLVGSLFCSTRLPPLRIWAIILFIDAVWPFGAMLSSGYGLSEVGSAFSHAITGVPGNAVAILIRAVGFFLMVYGGYWLRLALHGIKPGIHGKKATHLPY